MVNTKDSGDVAYTPQGEVGKQCKDCKNYVPVDDKSGNCFGHLVVASGSCRYFTPK